MQIWEDYLFATLRGMLHDDECVAEYDNSIILSPEAFYMAIMVKQVDIDAGFQTMITKRLYPLCKKTHAGVRNEEWKHVKVAVEFREASSPRLLALYILPVEDENV
jgi:hypothetical protein